MIVVRRSEFPVPEQGEPEHFDGEVELSKSIEEAQSGGIRVYLVSFHPGARTYWHAHEGEQVLSVVEGRGRVQLWGQNVREMGPGDLVHVAPGEKHWHGAEPDHAMSHLAITDGLTTWMEKVDD